MRGISWKRPGAIPAFSVLERDRGRQPSHKIIPELLRGERGQKANPTRKSRKGGTGCVLGAGGDGGGWWRMKPGDKTQVVLEKERATPPQHGENGGTDLNLLRKPSCGARLCLRRQGRLANRRPAAKELAWPTPGRLQRQSSSLNGIRHRRRFGGDARQAVWEWMLEQITGSRERAALPGSRHKTQNRRRRFGPGESSEGRRDAAWLAGETAGYPAKVPFRRPLVWRFCQKGKNRS